MVRGDKVPGGVRRLGEGEGHDEGEIRVEEGERGGFREREKGSVVRR